MKRRKGDVDEELEIPAEAETDEVDDLEDETEDDVLDEVELDDELADEDSDFEGVIEDDELGLKEIDAVDLDVFAEDDEP